jgi:hypothetical protein
LAKSPVTIIDPKTSNFCQLTLTDRNYLSSIGFPRRRKIQEFKFPVVTFN